MPAAAAIPFVLFTADAGAAVAACRLLGRHPDLALADALFDAAAIAAGELDWPVPSAAGRAALLRLREQDGNRLLDRLHEDAIACGRRAVGAVLRYPDALREVAIRDRLAGDPRVRVLHLRRGNLLAGHLAARRARGGGEPERIEIAELLRDFAFLELAEQEVEKLFAAHPTCSLRIEDCAADPGSTLLRIVDFLALDPRRVSPPEAGYRFETDAPQSPARAADEVRATLVRWLSFFDD